jgi:hypothetical protein
VIENSELAPTRARPEKSNNDLLEGISDEDLVRTSYSKLKLLLECKIPFPL